MLHLQFECCIYHLKVGTFEASFETRTFIQALVHANMKCLYIRCDSINAKLYSVHVHLCEIIVTHGYTSLVSQTHISCFGDEKMSLITSSVQTCVLNLGVKIIHFFQHQPLMLFNCVWGFCQNKFCISVICQQAKCEHQSKCSRLSLHQSQYADG